MYDSKNPLTSLGIWGGLGALGVGAYQAIPALVTLLTLLGVPAEDAAAAGGHAEAIYQAIVGVAAAVSGLVAIYGRWRASKRLSW